MSRPRRLVTLDCETDPFKYGRMPQPFLWGLFDGSRFNLFNNGRDLVGELSQSNCVAYAHNGGRFDYHFIASEIPVDTNMLVINGRLVSFKIGQCEFRDSFSLIPVPLAAYEKTKIDYTKLEADRRHLHRAEIEHYLETDCINLYNLITDFYERFGRQSKTLASAAMYQWKTINGPVGKTSRHYFELFRKFYHGGRTQALRLGEIKERFSIYDINSAYPYAMMHEHPYGDDFISVRANIDNCFDNAAFYIIDATSDGALCAYINGKLEFPSARMEFAATGWEINAALETKTIKIHNILHAYTFKQRINFSTYVERFYAEKMAAKKGSPAYMFAKLMLNSLYGKFGANPANYWHYKTANKALLQRLAPEGWQYSGDFGPHILIAKRLTDDEGRYYNIATAASITGFVRAYLWRAIRQAEKVYYCDTDSVVTPSSINESKKLGGWSVDGRCDYGAIAGRKLYALRLENGDWKTSSKGVRLTAAQIVAIAKGNRVEYRQDAPTFSIHRPPSFLLRNVKMTG